jgi:peptidoglycan biosynthesis protein MviN/MurJ (putative lipid II flippase)
MTTSPIVKAAIIGIFVMILVALGTAFVSLFRRRKDDDGRTTVKALTVRVGLSIGLLVALIILNALGVISPN